MEFYTNIKQVHVKRSEYVVTIFQRQIQWVACRMHRLNPILMKRVLMERVTFPIQIIHALGWAH